MLCTSTVRGGKHEHGEGWSNRHTLFPPRLETGPGPWGGGGGKQGGGGGLGADIKTPALRLRLNCFEVLEAGGSANNCPPAEKLLRACRWDTEKQTLWVGGGGSRRGDDRQTDGRAGGQTVLGEIGRGSCWKASLAFFPGYINSPSSALAS